jgi:tRNA (cmo5U34)-methyltransferase
MMEKTFDEHAATWDENPRRILMVNRVIEVLFKEIGFKKTDKILDYGCGTGLLGYGLLEKVGAITFCDTSEGMLEQVKKKKEFYGYQNVSIVKADLLKDNIPETFDLIFSMLVLHHVEDIKGILLNFSAHLKKNGVFCWIDLDKEDGSFHGDDSIPHFGFGKEKSQEIIKNIGFESFFYSSELYVEKEVDGLMRKYPLFILAARKG